MTFYSQAEEAISMGKFISKMQQSSWQFVKKPSIIDYFLNLTFLKEANDILVKS